MFKPTAKQRKLFCDNSVEIYPDGILIRSSVYDRKADKYISRYDVFRCEIDIHGYDDTDNDSTPFESAFVALPGALLAYGVTYIQIAVGHTEKERSIHGLVVTSDGVGLPFARSNVSFVHVEIGPCSVNDVIPNLSGEVHIVNT